MLFLTLIMLERLLVAVHWVFLPNHVGEKRKLSYPEPEDPCRSGMGRMSRSQLKDQHMAIEKDFFRQMMGHFIGGTYL
jgi:hypothetical protein